MLKEACPGFVNRGGNSRNLQDKPLWKYLQLIDYVLPLNDSVSSLSSLVLSLEITESLSLESLEVFAKS